MFVAVGVVVVVAVGVVVGAAIGMMAGVDARVVTTVDAATGLEVAQDKRQDKRERAAAIAVEAIATWALLGTVERAVLEVAIDQTTTCPRRLRAHVSLLELLLGTGGSPAVAHIA